MTDHFINHRGVHPPTRLTLHSAQTLIDGSGLQGPGVPGSLLACQQECGFGDSSQTSIDLVDGCTFWMAGESFSSQAQASVHTSQPGSAPSAFPHATGSGSADQTNPTV
ncbi:MAG: hypothetical protein J2P36_06960 [Ktedonobacteraceae bacterium]|nr:hypothetical protein [Ktedonobacteraceae bacterium]